MEETNVMNQDTMNEGYDNALVSVDYPETQVEETNSGTNVAGLVLIGGAIAGVGALGVKASQVIYAGVKTLKGEELKYREKKWQVWRPKFKGAPSDGDVVEATGEVVEESAEDSQAKVENAKGGKK